MDINSIKKRIENSNSIDELKKEGLIPPLPKINDNSNYVFVSYAHKDYKCVYCDLLGLYDRGVKYWYDSGLTPGMNWEEEVRSHIVDPHCSGIIYYLSVNSFTPSMMFEINCSNTQLKGSNQLKNYLT